MKLTLRWIAVLPAAILGGFLASFPLHWLIMWTCQNNPDSAAMVGEVSMLYYYRDSIERFLTPLATSMGFIYVGTITAPIYHLKVAITLAGIYLTSIGILCYLVINKTYLPKEIEYSANYYALLALNFLGIFLALWIVRFKASEWSKE